MIPMTVPAKAGHQYLTERCVYSRCVSDRSDDTLCEATMYKNILLTIDLNDETSYRKPLLSAIELARAFGARLQVLTGVRRLGNLQSGDRQQAAWLRCRRTSGRGRSVSSNLTGRPVFFCRTVARSTAYPLGATSRH